MDKSNKERLKNYGNIITDFCNGSDTDQILTDYFKNLQTTFNFSNNF